MRLFYIFQQYFQMLQSDDETLFILYYVNKISFQKFYLTEKNVTIILATKQTDFVGFFGKLFKTFYDCNFTLNLVKSLFITMKYLVCYYKTLFVFL